MSSSVTIPPSHQLTKSLYLACDRLQFGVTPDVLADVGRQAIEQIQASYKNQPPILPPVFIGCADDNITVSALAPDFNTKTFSDTAIGASKVVLKRDLKQFQKHSVNSATIISKMQKLRDKSDDLCMQQFLKGTLPRVISNRNIQELYPGMKSEKKERSTDKLYSPISVLTIGKKQLNELQKMSEEKMFQLVTEGEDPRVFHNEEMISVINDIINNDLAICISMLGAFMEHSIQIPLVDSPLDTAEILQTTEAPPAVGVWALFSLNMIDFQKMLQNKKGKALIVKVEKYIRSILSKSSLPEERYAGKLQFLMQCFDSSARCSDKYISYSLEVQLAKLCEDRKIQPKTTVKKLTKQWDDFFQGNILCHVSEVFRPLIARWIIWCLNIHHLREELSSHTTVGVIGLGNSGKSYLVKTLFKLKVSDECNIKINV